MNLDHIIEFYGETCPHCIAMRPIVAQLEKDLGGEIVKLEVWNNPEHEKKMRQYAELIESACGGFMAVPSFINTQTGQALCGAHNPEELKILFEGGECKDGVCMPHTKQTEKPQS